MDRRTYLKSSSAAMAALALAGCTSGGDGGSGNGGSETTTSSDGGSGDGGSETTTSESAGSNKIVIGSDIPYPPFEYKTNDGELTGFDPAIAEAVFKGELGYDYEFKDTSFDTIIPSLNNGNFRVIMSAMTITEKRAEKVDFSDPYFTAYQTVAILKNSDISTLEDLKGKTVAVQKGTTGQSAAESLKEEFGGDLTIDSYDEIAGAFNAMLNNQASAVINDNTVNAKYVNEQDAVVFLEGEGEASKQGKNAPDYLTLTVEEYGIAFRKGDELREEVNGALQAIRESGTYEEIYNEFFSG